MLSDKILAFLKNLRLNFDLPPSVDVMYPFDNPETFTASETFYQRFYHDEMPRTCIVGINPGRFGGGITGVPFTDPIRLDKCCGISNNWPKKQELSSVFIYDMINAFGGAEKFYRKFYITAISPVGFTAHGKNLNYYDDKLLLQKIRPFAVACFKEQLSWGLNNTVAYCLGEGKNFQYLSKLNAEENLFQSIVPLPHPRFIMQYKLKQKESFIDTYLSAFMLTNA